MFNMYGVFGNFLWQETEDRWPGYWLFYYLNLHPKTNWTLLLEHCLLNIDLLFAEANDLFILPR